MKIALAQLNPTIGDLVGNALQIQEAADIAATAGVRLLLTPELSLCGYPPRDLLLQPSFVAAMAIQLQQLAQTLPAEIAVLIGLAIAHPRAGEVGTKPLFNTMALVLGGQVQQYFHKQLLPTYDVFDEDRYFAPGDGGNLFTLQGKPGTPPLKIGVTVCEDLWNEESFWGKRCYPVNPLADLAAAGADLLVNLSASPYSLGKQRLREAMLHHGSHHYDLPILYVNQVGGNDDLVFDGSSVAVNRQGQVVARAPSWSSHLLLVEYDHPLNDVTTPLETAQQAIAPLAVCGEEEVFSALVLGVRDYARKCGFQRAILGLSGGIDSALVAAIAGEALGGDRVLGVLMPSPYSSDHSVQDALALVKNLGIAQETLPIAPMMTAYDDTLGGLFAHTPFGIAEENLQSRIRGTLLMAIANKFGHLLLSTGNKSEMAVGYCTLYGDMNGGLAVIADLPKTKVFDLCRWLNRDREIIPPQIIEKPPSAELRPGQRDSDSLPPYEVLDDILMRFIERHESPEAIAQAVGDPAIVQKVIHLVKRAEFKRRQAAPGLKITDRAFGTGWRMPIARH